MVFIFLQVFLFCLYVQIIVLNKNVSLKSSSASCLILLAIITTVSCSHLNILIIS